MSNIFNEINWFMNLWQPDHSAEDAIFDLMVKDIKQKTKEESPQKAMTADDFFSEVKKSKDKTHQEQIEYRNKKRWSEETLTEKVQSALKESAEQGVRYIMIKCDDDTVAKVNFKPVKYYLNSLGFNTKNLRVDSASMGYFGVCWYIEGPLYKCQD